MNHHEPVKLSLHAMATRFELVLYGAEPDRLHAAGDEALAEIESLDRQLSLYRPESDISWINANAAREPVKVEPRLFELLETAALISRTTGGAFDVTIAPLVRAWGFAGSSGAMADQERVDAARKVVGMEHVLFDKENFSIRFDRPGVEIDLGAIGKGYAIDRAVDLLRECGVTSALIHGGTSTIYAVGAPAEGDKWRVGVGESEIVELQDSSLSVSAVHGKSFTVEGREYGHVIDPGSGEPVCCAALAAVWGPSAMVTDALSTALLVLGEPGLGMLRMEWPVYHGMVMPSA